jgi:hypothetical protein
MSVGELLESGFHREVWMTGRGLSVLCFKIRAPQRRGLKAGVGVVCSFICLPNMRIPGIMIFFIPDRAILVAIQCNAALSFG